MSYVAESSPVVYLLYCSILKVLFTDCWLIRCC